MTDPASPAPAKSVWQRLYTSGPITAMAVIFGWFGVYFIYHQHWLGFVFCVITTLLSALALRRGKRLTLEQKRRLQVALDRAADRNRELEGLRHLAATLLAGGELNHLLEEVAKAASELLKAEGGMVTLVVEEGRFLRVTAASGMLKGFTGTLMPVDNSLSGWVVSHDQPQLTEDLDADERSFKIPGLEARLREVAIAPLRSGGLVVGTVGVVNRMDRQPFGENDLELLKTLGDQVVVGIDRTQMLEETRRNEQALEAKNRELQRATQLKSQFLANMSHELRTPLNAINGFSDLMLTQEVGTINEMQHEFLDSILRNGKHLLGLINSVLDLSKIEAGRMTLSLAKTDLHAAIQGVVTDTAPLRGIKNQECRVEIGLAPLNILADGTRVRQILFNLLSNASKFTPEGGSVSISAVSTRAPLPIPAERSSEKPRLVSRDAVWVSVSDTGMGIKPEDLPKLFHEFSQVDTSNSRQQQGTGLGLALSKRFVEMHGGTIGAESVYGRGTTFWFLLPLEGPPHRPGTQVESGVGAASL
jgi:signal transduction histidine kinase